MVFNIYKRFLLLKFKVKKFFKLTKFKKSKVTDNSTATGTFAFGGNCKKEMCGCKALFSTNENTKEEIYYVSTPNGIEHFKTFDEAINYLKPLAKVPVDYAYNNVKFGKVFGGYVNGIVRYFDYPEIKKILDEHSYKWYKKPNTVNTLGTTINCCGIETKPTNIVRTTGTRLILNPHSEPVKKEKSNEDWTINLKPYNIPSYTKTTNWPYLFNPPHGGYLYSN